MLKRGDLIWGCPKGGMGGGNFGLVLEVIEAENEIKIKAIGFGKFVGYPLPFGVRSIDELDEIKYKDSIRWVSIKDLSEIKICNKKE